MQKLGSDPNKLYTFENLQSQLKQFSVYALIFAPMVLQIRVAKPEHFADLDDFTERIERGEDADIMKEFDSETMIKYSTLINDLVTDLVRYGYIQYEHEHIH